MKIAIVTSFRSMPESYSLVNDVRDRIRTLVRYGHEVVFFAQEGCKGDGIVCPMRAVLPRVKLRKDEVNEEGVKLISEILIKELKDFNLVFTDDLLFIRQYVTYREAIFIVGKALPDIKWAHWIHSRVGEMLNLKMPNAKYIFMNHIGVEEVAKHCGVEEDDVHVIFNDKDPRIFFEFSDITKQLIDKYDLLNYEIMQVYPICTTRMGAKGVEKVINVFSELKKKGRKVKLVFANSNGRKDIHIEAVKKELEYAKNLGLEPDEDVIFTSRLDVETQSGVPRQVIQELMRLANLFVFPSQSEVCSNVLLEASMSKTLMVLNEDFPPMFDFSTENSVLKFPFGSMLRHRFMGNTDTLKPLVDEILENLDNSKSNQQFLYIKDACNVDSLYKNMYKPLLEWANK